MAPACFASLCRLLRWTHYKSRAKSLRRADRNFMAEMRGAAFRLCRGQTSRRNGRLRYPTGSPLCSASKRAGIRRPSNLHNSEPASTGPNAAGTTVGKGEGAVGRQAARPKTARLCPNPPREFRLPSPHQSAGERAQGGEDENAGHRTDVLDRPHRGRHARLGSKGPGVSVIRQVSGVPEIPRGTVQQGQQDVFKKVQPLGPAGSTSAARR